MTTIEYCVQEHLDASQTALPRGALMNSVVPRCRRIIADAVRGAFAAPLPVRVYEI
jgi:hypothetical protein